MLPGGSGIELARHLRENEFAINIPIIMLTAKTSEDNKVQGLNEGVDDYVTKPFSPRELVARIKTVLRRVNGDQKDKVLRAFDLQLDPVRHRLFVEEKEVEIGPTEFRLLKFFLLKLRFLKIFQKLWYIEVEEPLYLHVLPLLRLQFFLLEHLIQ